MGVSQDEYRELARKEQKLQKDVIKLSEENIELKFEVESARKDIPRLKVNTISSVLMRGSLGDAVVIFKT